MSDSLQIEWRSERPAFEEDDLFLDQCWLSAAARAHGRELVWLTCADDAGLAAAWPVLGKTRLGLRIASNPPHVPYLPLWLRPDLKEPTRLTVQRAFAEALRKQFHKANLAPGPVTPDVRGFTWGGLRARPYYTYIIDLTQPQCGHKSKKEALRKARRLTPELREELDIDLFLGLQRVMFAHQGLTPPMAPGVMKPWLLSLADAGLLRQLTSYVGDTPVVSHAWLFDPQRRFVFAWLGANHPDSLTDGMATWAFDAIFKLLRQQGFDTLDLCGANIPRLNHYYETFGGRLALYFRLTKPMPGLLALLPGGSF